MGRGDDVSGGLGRRGPRQPFGRFDGPGRPRRDGFYPTKGRGHGQQGEAVFPDLLDRLSRTENWSSWRRGQELALTALAPGRAQVQPLEVLALPAWRPQDGFKVKSAIAVRWGSTSSPDGCWTTVIKPRGTEIAADPIKEHAQRDRIATTPDGTTIPLLVVGVSGCWDSRVMATGSGLIGELIEDSGLSSTTVAEEDDDALLLLCIGIDPVSQTMTFDASRAWRRQRTASGGRVLKQVEPPVSPRFRVGRHLCQSTVVSCNCPAHIGLEYGRLNRRPGGASSYPQFSSVGRRVDPNDPLDVLLNEAGNPESDSSLDGAARRFRPVAWQRLPGDECKHCHAARHLLGCPLAEPDPMTAALSGLKPLLPEETVALMDLAQPGYRERLAREQAAGSAWRDLAGMMTSGSAGDAFSITVERLALQSSQLDGVLGAEVFRNRFLRQQVGEDFRAAEDAVTGDVFVGDLSRRYSFPYGEDGLILDTPFVLTGGAEPAWLA